MINGQGSRIGFRFPVSSLLWKNGFQLSLENYFFYKEIILSSAAQTVFLAIVHINASQVNGILQKLNQAVLDPGIINWLSLSGTDYTVTIFNIYPIGINPSNTDFLAGASIRYSESQVPNRYFNEAMRHGLVNNFNYIIYIVDYSLLSKAAMIAAIAQLINNVVMVEKNWGYVLRPDIVQAGGLLNEGVSFSQAISDWKSTITTNGYDWES